MNDNKRKKPIAIPENRRWKAFFEAYKTHPALWNIQSGSYGDKIKKEIALKELLDVYKRIDRNANVLTLKNRLHKIKTVYLRELKKVLRSIQHGGAPDSMYVPNLWYFHQLDFLHNVYSKNFTIPSFNVEKGVCLSDEDLSSEEDDYNENLNKTCVKRRYELDKLRIAAKMPKKKSFKDIHEVSSTSLNVEKLKGVFFADECNESLLEELKLDDDLPENNGSTTLGNIISMPMDEVDLYAKVWSTSFRKVNQSYQTLCRKAIDNIFFLAESNQLDIDTVQIPNVTKVLTKNGTYVAKNNAEVVQNKQTQMPINEFNKGINLNKEEFLKSCIGLLVCSDMPLNTFDDLLYFKQIIKPYEELYNFNLNGSSICEYIYEYSVKIKSFLKAKFSAKMLCLKIDVVTSSNNVEKSILGIHFQYVEDYSIILTTIGQLVLKEISTTSISNAICKCLQDYDIDVKQIYSVTSDEVKHPTILNGNISQMIMEEVVPELRKNHYQFDPLILTNTTQFIQQAASDCFNNIESFLIEVREFVKLITKTVKERKISQYYNKLPKLDDPTNWSTTFEMVSILRTLEFGDFQFDFEINWIYVEMFIETFTPLEKCRIQSEKEHLVIGDFYRDWLVCEAKLKKLNQNVYADKLLLCMNEVKKTFLENDAFLSALYLDQRFNFLNSPFFDTTRKKAAEDCILRAHSLLQTINNGTKGKIRDSSLFHTLQTDVSSNAKSAEANCITDAYDILDEELNLLFENERNKSTIDIRQKLEELSFLPRLQFATNIFQHWKNTENMHPDMARIVQVILSVSSNQISLQRTLKALSIVQNNSTVSDENLENLLFLKLNQNILHAID